MPPFARMSCNVYVNHFYSTAQHFEILGRLSEVFLNLWFATPCIIIHSTESTNQMQQFIRFIACRLNAAQHVSGILMPIIMSLSTAAAASGLPIGNR